MPYSVKGFFEINEDMVQILLMLKVLFTQDSKVEDLFCGASSGSEPGLFFSNYFFSWGFKPILHDFQHDFARMTDEAIGVGRGGRGGRPPNNLRGGAKIPSAPPPPNNPSTFSFNFYVKQEKITNVPS